MSSRHGPAFLRHANGSSLTKCTDLEPSEGCQAMPRGAGGPRGAADHKKRCIGRPDCPGGGVRANRCHPFPEPQKPLDKGEIVEYICLQIGTYYALYRKRNGDAMMPSLTVETWVDSMQARGRYTFLRSEAISGSGLSAEAVKKALQRLARRRRVAKVKNYFYVIVPLEYLHAGAPPPSWFIDDLMKAMERPYYVGLLSAAGIHGASHQQPQEFQVLTDRPIRPLEIGRARIRFFVSKRSTDTAVQNVKTPTGAMRVSTPEATAVDLVRFARVAGHLDNVATVLVELVPLLDPKKLLNAVRASGDLPNAQRLGYVLERVRGRPQAKALREWLERQSLRVVPLRPGRTATDATEDRRWHVSIAEPIEIET